MPSTASDPAHAFDLASPSPPDVDAAPGETPSGDDGGGGGPRWIAGAARSDDATLECQARLLDEDRLLREVLGALPNMVVVLNEHRQVVFANDAVRAFAADASIPLRGRRPGEILECANADAAPGGCGCSEACRSCGVLGAILQALGGGEATEEAQLTLTSGRPLEVQAKTRSVGVGTEQMVVLTLSDIADLKRRRALERTFFHDVLNTAGGIEGLVGILEGAAPEEHPEIHGLLASTARQLVEEIESHRLLTATEAEGYVVRSERVRPRAVLERAAAGIRPLARARGVAVTVATRIGDDVTIETDPVLLHRVVANLTKNAVEASLAGQAVRLGASLLGERVTFRVHNPGAMPPEVQRRLFQRSFSTKGEGRGLGAYSVKLFAEGYLGGEVTFESTDGLGTVFHVTLPVRVARGDGLAP